MASTITKIVLPNGTECILKDSNALPKSGGVMTGDIQMSKGGATFTPVATYAGDTNGMGLVIGAGGRTIIGSGESAANLRKALGTKTTDESSEVMYISSDGAVYICTNCQEIASRSTITIGTNGSITAPGGFVGSLSGKATSAGTADSANSVAWSNVSSKPSFAAVATSGKYSDLSGTPTIPTVNSPLITIKQNGTSKGTFNLNQATAATIELTDSNTTYSTMGKASASTGGASGLVPASSAGDQNKFLKADGTWAVPTDTNTNYYHTTGTWSGLTYTATANGGAGALAFTLPTGTSSTTVSRGDHTHSAVSSSANGMMTPALLSKLNGIAESANNYSLPAATNSIRGGVTVGNNIGLSGDKISLSGVNVTSALGYTPLHYVQNTGSSADLNNLEAEGIYGCISDAHATSGTNYPSKYAGILLVYSDTYNMYQMYLSSNGSVYYRCKPSGGSWGDWLTLVTNVALTNLLSTITQQINIFASAIPTLSSSTGTSTTQGMTQKAITDAIKSSDVFELAQSTVVIDPSQPITDYYVRIIISNGFITDLASKLTITNSTTPPGTIQYDNPSRSIKFKISAWFDWSKTLTTTVKHSVLTGLSSSVNYQMLYYNFEDVPWNKIQEIVRAGNAKYVWKVGDSKTFILKPGGSQEASVRYIPQGVVGRPIAATIVGIDHNPSHEGAHSLHLAFDCALRNTNSWNLTWASTSNNGLYMNTGTSASNTGGWKSSFMRNTVLRELYGIIPDDLKNVMATDAVKVSNNTGGNTNSSSVYTETQETLFLASAYELTGSTSSIATGVATCQSHYTYYSSGSSRVYFAQSLYGQSVQTLSEYYTRSVDINQAGMFREIWCSSSTNGQISSAPANKGRDIVPMFVIH